MAEANVRRRSAGSPKPGWANRLRRLAYSAPMSESPRHAYVHVPFCRHRCGYCDFTLVAGRDDLIERYFAALTRELERIYQPLELDTLYLGGGTPSHLGPDGLRRLFGLLATKLGRVGDN